MSYPIVVGPKTVTITDLKLNKTAAGEGTITSGTYKITDTSGGPPPPPPPPYTPGTAGPAVIKAMGDAATALRAAATFVTNPMISDITGSISRTDPASGGVTLAQSDANFATQLKAANDAATAAQAAVVVAVTAASAANAAKDLANEKLLTDAATALTAGETALTEILFVMNNPLRANSTATADATLAGDVIDNLTNIATAATNAADALHINTGSAITGAAGVAGLDKARRSRETFLGGKRRSTRQNRKASSRKTRSHGRR